MGVWTLCVLASYASGARRPTYQDRLVVPTCHRAPTIDGRMAPGEWDRAAAVTGFQHIFSYMTERQAVAYVTYDDKRIYVAFDSRFKKGAKLRRVARERDHRRLCADDTIEIWIAPDFVHARKLQYQFLGNSLGVIQDFRRLPDIGDALLSWNGEWLYRCTSGPGWWQAEAAIDRDQVELTDDRQDFGLNFCRDYATHYFTNVTTGGFGNFMRATWGGEAPAVQVLDLGPILQANMNARLAVCAGAAPAKVRVSVDVRLQADNAPIAAGTQEIDVPARSRRQATLAIDWRAKVGKIDPFTGDRSGPGWTRWTAKGRKKVVLKATDVATGRVLLEHTLLVKEGLTDPVQQGTPRAFEIVADLYPSYGLLRAGADIYDFAHKARVRRVTVEITAPGGRDVLGRGEITAFKLAYGETNVKHAPLADGTHQATFRALDAAGRVLATESAAFDKKSFPWETVRVGVSDEVIPPFTPLVVRGSVVHCWGRAYHHAPTGLPEKIVTRGADVLAHPCRLEGTAEGKALRFEPTRPIRWLTKQPGVVELAADSRSGPLGLQVHVRTEYDGMMKYTLRLVPRGRMTVDRLSLVVPFHDRHAVLLHSVGEVNRMNSRAGYVPKGTGVVWTSREARNATVLGTFIPYWWLGDHDRGLCWMADNDRGWSTDAVTPNGGSVPAVEFVRRGDVLSARVNLFAVPKTIAKPVELVFALEAGPCRPEPPGWRLARLPGNPALPGQTLRLGWYCRGVRTFQGYGRPPDMAKYLKMVRAYRAEFGTGFGVNMSPNDLWGKTEENKYYVAEWSPGYPSLRRNDYVMYHLDKLLAAGYIEGLYSDVTSPVPWNNVITGIGYVRDDGRVQAGYTIFAHRDFYKRTAYLHHKHRGKFGTLVHMTGSMVLPSYGFWTGKHDNEWSRGGPGRDAIDVWPLGELCARSMSRQWGLTATWHTPAVGHGDDLQCLLLLHDMVGRVSSRQNRCLPAQLLFGLGEPDVAFMGYWALGCKTDPVRPKVLASAWVRPTQHTALVAVVNLSDAAWQGRIHLPLGKLGVAPDAVACDGEENRPSLPMHQGALAIAVPRHNYRIVLVGNKGVYPADLARLGSRLPRPAKRLPALCDDFNGPKLDPAWRLAASPAANASIETYRTRLCVRAPRYKFGTAERDLDTDNVTVQVRVERPAGAGAQNRVGLALVWAQGTGREQIAFAGPCLRGKQPRFAYMLVANGKTRHQRGSPACTPNPDGMHQPNWVRIRLNPNTIVFSGSGDGRTWHEDWTVDRPKTMSAAPRVLRLGESPDGQVRARRSGMAYSYFDDLVVGRDGP